MSEVALVAIASSLVAFALFLVRGSEPRTTYRLTFPRDLRDEQLVVACRALTGLQPTWWRRVFGAPVVVLEAAATPAGITHTLRVPVSRAEQVVGSWRAALPGLRVEEIHAGDADLVEEVGAVGGRQPDLARELRVVGSGDLRADVAAEANTGLLAALQPLRREEAVVVQCAIAPVGRASRFLERLRALLAEDDRPATRGDREPDLAVAVRIGVTAASPARRRQLVARLLGAFHPAGSSDAWFVRRLLPSAVVSGKLRRGAPPGGGSSLLAADELAAVAGVPLESPSLPGLTLTGARELPAAASIARRGLVLGDSPVAGAGRPVALGLEELRRGLHLCAPTGAGKSTVLLGCATQLMRAGHGLVLIDSKGDLAADALDRVPAARRGEVVVFDPADAACPVGFNLIGGTETSELIVDHVVGQFRARYGAAGLGPRSEDILRSCLLTLATKPGYTLCEVEPLLTNPGFRQRLIGGLDEPVLEGFWAWYASLSEAARAEAVAPLLNKVRTYTLRRRVRAVIGQSGGLDLARVLNGAQVLIVSLARGVVGEDAAALIGAAMTARLWTVIQGRAALPSSKRRPVAVICDEFQDFAALTVSFADAVAQSRGYNVGWVLAHQHLAQLDTATRQAVLANCRSRVVMQTTAADASAFAREFAPFLEPADLQGLPAFEGYAAISTGAAVAPAASIRTRPAPEPLGSTDAVREASRRRFGMTPAAVDAAIRERVAGGRPSAPVGGRRRT